MNYWLMKSEPGTFSIDDLMQQPHQIENWNGVRNYEARNMLRDLMKVNDLAFFYHSSCKTPGIVGIIKIVREGYVDDSAFDTSHEYYDVNSSSVTHPRWYQLDVKFVKKFKKTIPLSELKHNPLLSSMRLLRKGNRLSIMPVTVVEWDTILKME